MCSSRHTVCLAEVNTLCLHPSLNCTPAAIHLLYAWCWSEHCAPVTGQYTVPTSNSTQCASYWSVHGAYIKQHTVCLVLVNTLYIHQSEHCAPVTGQYTVPTSNSTQCASYWSVHGAYIKQHTVCLELVCTQCPHQTAHSAPLTGQYTVPTSNNTLYAWNWSVHSAYISRHAICLVLVKIYCASISRHTVCLALVNALCINRSIRCIPGDGQYTVPLSINTMYACINQIIFDV